MKEFYWIKPAGSKKWHIHNGDGMSLCRKWLMTNTEEKVSKSPVFGKDDCKICIKQYEKLIGENHE